MIYRIKIDVFVIGDGVKKAFEEACQDRRLLRSDVNIFSGGLEVAPEYYAENTTPAVLFVEEDGDDEEMMEHLGRLAELCEPDTKVVVIGHLNDISMYRSLIQQGISEYLMPPIDAPTILETLDEILVNPEEPKVGKVIAFYGVHGGVGTSSIAQNVAWQLSQMCHDEVAIIDTDIPFGTTSLSFNVDPKQTIVDAISQPARLDEALLDRYIVKLGNGLRLLSAPAKLESQMPISVEAIEKVLDLMKEMVSYVIVDMPHTWAPWVDRVLTDADETVIVATPDLNCFRDMKNVVDLIGKKRGKEAPLSILFNFFDAYKKTQLSPKDFQETLKLEPKAIIPFDPALFGVASNNGQMLEQVNKSHKVVDMLRKLSCELTGFEDSNIASLEGGSLQDKFSAWLKSSDE